MKSNASLGSKKKNTKANRKKIKEKKLNFVLIQNGTILVIFGFPAKVQLFQQFTLILLRSYSVLQN